MQIILDNIIFSLQKAGGISGAWSKLIQELLKHPELDIWFLERKGAKNNLFRATLNIPENRIIHYDNRSLKLDRYSNVNLGKLRPFADDEQFVFHSSYYRYCTDRKAINVITLHDFIYEETHGNSYFARLVHTSQKNKAIRHAAGIACVSHSTLKRLDERYNNIKALKTVIYNPVVCSYQVDKTPQKPYLLFVGNRVNYKNFENCVDVAEKTGLPLLSVGKPFGEKEKKNLRRRRLYSFNEAYPSNERLAELYTNALCLLYPSSHEGFGIPIIEAQAHGCPVIISDCDACMEVGGEAAMVAPDASVNTMADYINQLQAPQTRNDIIQKGYANIARFDLSDITSRYLSLYSNLLAHHSTEKYNVLI